MLPGISLATNSPAEPRGEVGGGQLDSGGGKEDGLRGHNDTLAKVLQLLDQLRLIHAHNRAEEIQQPMVNISRQLRNTIVNQGEIL